MAAGPGRCPSQLTLRRRQNRPATPVNTLVEHDGGELFATGIGQRCDDLRCGHVCVSVPRFLDVDFGAGAFLGTLRTKVSRRSAMFTNMLVGVDHHCGATDAIALAKQLSAEGATLTLAHVHAGDPYVYRGVSAEYEASVVNRTWNSWQR